MDRERQRDRDGEIPAICLFISKCLGPPAAWKSNRVPPFETVAQHVGLLLLLSQSISKDLNQIWNIWDFTQCP